MTWQTEASICHRNYRCPILHVSSERVQAIHSLQGISKSCILCQQRFAIMEHETKSKMKFSILKKKKNNINQSGWIYYACTVRKRFFRPISNSRLVESSWHSKQCYFVMFLNIIWQITCSIFSTHDSYMTSGSIWHMKNECLVPIK
jgi:hypothetical protein